MQGPGRSGILNAGSRKITFIEFRVQGRADIVNAGSGERADIVNAGSVETRYIECRVRGDRI
ncbi:unnamed protein product [Staurois parvus]|uniref:Pectinesterase n=1 Tax=Staurois parvus TaxID=386267 RepID=A0ABN9CYN9_9NEOB|nr:unnamed protein product [Staurois parvus]